MPSGRLGQLRLRIAADHENGVGLAALQDIHGRVLTRVEARIAARQVDGAGITGLPGHDVLGARQIAGAAHRHANEACVRVHVADQSQKSITVQARPWPTREPRAEEDHTVLRLFHAVHESMPGRKRSAGGRLDAGRVELDPLDERPQGPKNVEILLGLDRNEKISLKGAARSVNVNDNAVAVSASVRHERAVGREAIPAEVARVALGRIGAPEDDEVAAVLDLAQGASDFTDFLEGDDRGRAKRTQVCVHAGTKTIAERNGSALGLGSGARKTANYRVSRVVQDPSGPLDAFFERGGLSRDHALRSFGAAMAQEPRFAESTRVRGVSDAVSLDLERDVIAHAAAKRAGGVLNDFGS